MYILVAIIVVILILIAVSALYTVFKSQIHFMITGLDSGFSVSDLLLLYKVATLCELEQPTSLFWSMAALNRCMSHINTQASADGNDQSQKHQQLMTKLYNYRTKIQNEADEKKGLSSTISLDKGQKLRIILPGKGVFASEIVANGQQLVINVPRQKNLIPITAEEWVGKVISVYLWRKGDARYVFDTNVTQSGLYIGKPSLFLNHSNNLIRTQKRKAVRAACEIYAQLYIIRKPVVNYQEVETKDGYKCLIQDISESGAMIKIGGKAIENVQIKLQFTIKKMLIIMFGVVRTVDYNETENVSILHFECIHLEQSMRNEILSFVYNTLPENEKEIIEALNQTEEDNEELESVLINENGEVIENPDFTAKQEMSKINEEAAQGAADVTSTQQPVFNNNGPLPDLEDVIQPKITASTTDVEDLTEL